jgi:hypothetical protein
VITCQRQRQRQQQTAINNTLAPCVQIFPAAVRAGYNSTDLLAHWRKTLQTWCQTNLYCSVSHSGIEGLGALGTVNEMLMQVRVPHQRPLTLCHNIYMYIYIYFYFFHAHQSHEGYIRIFPGVPLGSRYFFTTLRAINATLVSAWVDELGFVHDMVVTSEQGSPIILYQPWEMQKAIGAPFSPPPLFTCPLPH